MLTFFVLAGTAVAAALALVALDVIRPPERIVAVLFFAFFLLILLGVAWVGMLLLRSV